MLQLNPLDLLYWEYCIIKNIRIICAVKRTSTKALKGIQRNFLNANKSHSLFILGREVDQEVQLVQVYF